jgi:hypothetical protein
MRVVSRSYKAPGTECEKSAAQNIQSINPPTRRAIKRRTEGKGRQMDFKFTVGQTVEYKPANGLTSLCTIVKQIPKEDGQLDLRYRIKNEHGTFERNVFEYDLTASDKPANLYDFVARLHRAKHH